MSFTRRGAGHSATLAALALMAASPAAAQCGPASGAVRFITLDPGHFHAALVHKEMYPEVSPEISIYAPLGFDLIEHLKRLTAFNERRERPTGWRTNVHTGPDFFERMLADRAGNVLVLSGRNRKKMDYIQAVVENGLNVLADKPWIIRTDDFPRLERVLDLAESKGLVAYDVMTERYEVTNALQRELVNDPAVFGRQVTGTVDEPGVYMKSIHYISKTVAGAPLVRPAWFFDIREQGEALSDIGTHLVDLSIWTLSPTRPVDYRRDAKLVSARRWPTVMTLQQFGRVTGERTFPASLREWVVGDRFSCYCNTQVVYTLGGTHVKLDVLWDYESAEHGDTHDAFYRGTNARIEVRQGAEERWRPETYVVPADPSRKSRVLAAVKSRVAALQEQWPGVGYEDRGRDILITIPDRFRTGHEAHFAEVTSRFLEYLRAPRSVPAWEEAAMLAKYYITTQGADLSHRGGESSVR